MCARSLFLRRPRSEGIILYIFLSGVSRPVNSPFGKSTFHCFCARFGDEEMILDRNIDYRSILQKTLEQFLGQQLQKTKVEIKEQLSLRLSSHTSLLMFLQSAF